MVQRIIAAVGVSSAVMIGSKVSQDTILRKNGWTYDKTQHGWFKKTSTVDQATVEGKILMSNMVWSMIGLCGGIIGYFCTRK